MKNIDEKIVKFIQFLCITNNNLKPKLTKKFNRLNIYNTLAKPVLLRGSKFERFWGGGQFVKTENKLYET